MQSKEQKRSYSFVQVFLDEFEVELVNEYEGKDGSILFLLDYPYSFVSILQDGSLFFHLDFKAFANRLNLPNPDSDYYNTLIEEMPFSCSRTKDNIVYCTMCFAPDVIDRI